MIWPKQWRKQGTEFLLLLAAIVMWDTNQSKTLKKSCLKQVCTDTPHGSRSPIFQSQSHLCGEKWPYQGGKTVIHQGKQQTPTALGSRIYLRSILKGSLIIKFSNENRNPISPVGFPDHYPRNLNISIKLLEAHLNLEWWLLPIMWSVLPWPVMQSNRTCMRKNRNLYSAASTKQGDAALKIKQKATEGSLRIQ